MLRVRVVSTGWSGSPGLSTWYFSPTAETVADANSVTASVRAFYVYAAEYLPAGVGWQVASEVDVVNPATGAVTDTLVATDALASVPGTKSASIVPPSVVAVLSLLTDTFIAGRRIRGRSFLGPLSQVETLTAAGGLGDAAKARYVTGVENLIATGGDPTIVVWHRPKGGSGGEACPVVGCSVATKLGVLRSRRD